MMKGGKKLATQLNEGLISLHIPGDDKWQVIEALMDLAMKTGRIKDRQAALTAVVERERKMSTGIQYGIAIPHGACEGVNDLIACIGIKPEGVEFKSLDGQPSRIIIMTISPINRTGPHIQFLAEISRILRSEANRKAFVEAQTPADILALF